MNTTKPDINSMLALHMKYMTQRQGVLAQNIANIDTPNYKANDLKKPDFSKMIAAPSPHLGMTATAPQHMNGTLAGNGSGFASVKDRETFEISPTKNNVVLEDQMGKISDTAAQFQLSSSMMRKFTQLYRTAVGTR
ncbi:MAG: flagellar basal body protein [Alphaproteobacteria bacterium]|nr:flagellar basal body protein [Alphaproteobacteria bacterium]